MNIILKGLGMTSDQRLCVPENTTDKWKIILLQKSTYVVMNDREPRLPFETECTFEWCGGVDSNGDRIYDLVDITKR